MPSNESFPSDLPPAGESLTPSETLSALEEEHLQDLQDRGIVSRATFKVRVNQRFSQEDLKAVVDLAQRRGPAWAVKVPDHLLPEPEPERPEQPEKPS